MKLFDFIFDKKRKNETQPAMKRMSIDEADREYLERQALLDENKAALRKMYPNERFFGEGA